MFGWRAELGGQTIPLSPGSCGRMQINLPAGSNGVLNVVFSMTPMRRFGVWISLCTVWFAFVGCVSMRALAAW